MKKLLKDTDTSVAAYIFADGILFRFERRVKVGDTYTRVKCIGRVKKAIRIGVSGSKRFPSEGNKPSHYLVKVDASGRYDLTEKALLGITAIDHYLDCFQEDGPMALAGIRCEHIVMRLEGVGTIESHMMHGVPGCPGRGLDLGQCQPLTWAGVSGGGVDQCFDNEASSGATVAFDVVYGEG